VDDRRAAAAVHDLARYDVRSTAKAINWVEQQFGLNYSESGVGKLLGRLDYRYKQPADGERVAQLLQKIRAANSGKRLLRTFQDPEQVASIVPDIEYESDFKTLATPDVGYTSTAIPPFNILFDRFRYIAWRNCVGYNSVDPVHFAV
jgi:hypothetical protein